MTRIYSSLEEVGSSGGGGGGAGCLGAFLRCFWALLPIIMFQPKRETTNSLPVCYNFTPKNMGSKAALLEDEDSNTVDHRQKSQQDRLGAS